MNRRAFALLPVLLAAPAVAARAQDGDEAPDPGDAPPDAVPFESANGRTYYLPDGQPGCFFVDGRSEDGDGGITLALHWFFFYDGGWSEMWETPFPAAATPYANAEVGQGFAPDGRPLGE